MRENLLIALLFGTTTISIAQPIDTTTKQVEYKGNQFVTAPLATSDSLEVMDPITRKNSLLVWPHSPFPISMNGQHIYSAGESGLKGLPTITWLEEKIIGNLKNLLFIKGVKNGHIDMRLWHIVADNNGKIVFSDFRGVLLIPRDIMPVSLAITNQDTLFNNIALSPVPTYNGRAVSTRYNLDFRKYDIRVKDHKIVCRKKKAHANR